MYFGILRQNLRWIARKSRPARPQGMSGLCRILYDSNLFPGVRRTPTIVARAKLRIAEIGCLPLAAWGPAWPRFYWPPKVGATKFAL